MLAASYLIHGGEPYQTQEIIATIKQQASNHDYNNYVVHEITTQTDWEQLLDKCQNFDLFADKTLMEVRLRGDTVNKYGNQVLESILQLQDHNLCILISAEKLKPQTLNNSWVKKVAKVHVARPIPSASWSQWIKQRLQLAGLSADPEAIAYIAKRYEGNLPACVQMINKLKANVPTNNLDLSTIALLVEDNSKFSVFDLANAAIAGDSSRITGIINSLKADGMEPIIILWSITREVRQLLNTKYQQRTLPTLSVQKLQAILIFASKIDQMIKGIIPGNVWDALLALCLAFTNHNNLPMEEMII